MPPPGRFTHTHAHTDFFRAKIQIRNQCNSVHKLKESSLAMMNECNETALAFYFSKHLPFVLFPDVVFLREVNEVNHWFGCQKQVFVQHFDL